MTEQLRAKASGPSVSAERLAFEMGAFAAFDEVLQFLGTLPTENPDKGEIYSAVFAMRPADLYPAFVAVTGTVR